MIFGRARATPRPRAEFRVSWALTICLSVWAANSRMEFDLGVRGGEGPAPLAPFGRWAESLCEVVMAVVLTGERVS